MEELKSRLNYDDIHVRSRCLQKLSASVQKKAKESVIDSSSVQIPELNLILETCEDDSPITSNLAVQVLISLVESKHVDPDYAINKLLGCLKSPRNYQSVLNGISSILYYVAKHQTESNTFKYSLLFPKHPLISAIENKSDCFPYALESMLLGNDPRFFNEKEIRVMEPFLCHVFCNPDPEMDFNKALLLEAISPRLEDFCITPVLKYVPFMQVESAHKAAEVSYFFLKLSDAIAKIYDDDCVLDENLLIRALSLSERSITHGHFPSQMLELGFQLTKLLFKMPERSSSLPENVCLLLISYMLKSLSGEFPFLSCIECTGILLLDLANVSPTVAALVALSVIHFLPSHSCKYAKLSRFLVKLELVYFKNRDKKSGDHVSFETNSNDIHSPNDSKKEQANESFESANSEEESVLNDREKSSPSDTKETKKKKNLRDFFSKRAVEGEEDNFELVYSDKNYNFDLIESFTSKLETTFTCVRFSVILDKADSSFKYKWLESVKQYVDFSKKEKFDTVYSLTAALFLMSEEDERFLSLCLNTFESILLKTPHLSIAVFSLLLYKLSHVKQPKSKFLILNFLPKSAVHKYAVPPVLGILQKMANETELRAQAIYLLLQLWKKQDRCFPHLHNLLAESNKSLTSDSEVDEILIAQASAILEICITKPEKHGQEFLNTLASIFNKCSNDANTPVACLAVDGIIALCKHEIIDIRSTWKALSAKLCRDKRTLVSCRMYQLLSLIPELRVKSFDYDKFMSETVAFIWKQVASNTLSQTVLCESYKTLAKFPMDCHVLQQLPAAAKINLKLPSSMKATPFEMSKLPEDVLSYIPGYCFIDLLGSYEDKTVLDGYTSFLHSLVKMEIEELPRSAYSQTRHIAKQKKISEALSKVPEFLCTHFHSRKSPALQKNLAVGVLFCYEPPIEMGKDGLPIKRSIATQSRNYEQVLPVLLNEVNIDTTEWHRCVLISNAWASFIERAFFACEEARRAELELQRAHGHLDVTAEDFNYQCKTAWLWVRERFLGIIKTNVKNTSTAQANGIFAISGLVFAADKFYANLDESSKTLSEENDKYTIHRHFVADFVDTIICAMHSEFVPTGKVQSWLLTHLSRPNSSVGYLVTGCASSSLCHLTSMLIQHYSDEIPNLIQIMLQNAGHSSPALSFYSGKGLGLLIKSLCETGYTDVESQLQVLLNAVKEMMKMYEDSNGSLSSSLIGLTISMTSLSQIADDNVKDLVSTTCNVFYEKLMDEEKSSMQFEMLCICVTAMIIAASEGSCLPIQSVEDLASWIEMNKLEIPQCSGISVSLGMLIEAFERFGHSEGAEMKQKVLKGWFNTVTSERKPTLQKIAALNGLCSLFSCGRGLMQVKSRLSADSISALNELVPIMFQILSAAKDTGLQSICSWEVARLFSVHSNQQQVESSVSTSYSYLGEKSILKPLMNVILGHQKEDAPTYKHCHVVACLKCIAASFPRPLPPINWVLILTPFLQESEDPETIEAALKLAVYQCNGSSYAANLISSYCNPPLIHTLPELCFKVLLDNMPAIILTLPAQKLQAYLQTVISHTIKKDEMIETLGNLTLQGILNSLKQTGYKDQSKKILQGAFISVMKYFKTKEKYLASYLSWISQGLMLLPEEILNSELLVTKNPDEVALLTMIWCHLVKTGKKSLSNLRACVEEAKCSSSKQKEKICLYIYDCFLYGIHNEESEVSQPNKCISWLLETIGWIRVLEDTKSKYQLLTTGEVYTFLLDVCFSTIIGCSGLENSYSFLVLESLEHNCLLESVPQAISCLSRKSEWNAVIDKIIDWFLMLLKSQYLKDEEKYYIKLALCSLRSTNQFQRKEVWTEVISISTANISYT